ncbi:hypothetical protein ABIE00_005078 [Arthrobacter sp. OAP107]
MAVIADDAASLLNGDQVLDDRCHGMVSATGETRRQIEP